MPSPAVVSALLLLSLVAASETARPASGGSKAAPTPSPPPKRGRSGGIGAWGIVALVVVAIVLSIGGYYFAILYPLLCAEHRKYDVIESCYV